MAPPNARPAHRSRAQVRDVVQAPAEAVLRTHELGRRYGALDAVRGVSLAVPGGGVLALLGPSGCGKTTLLRLVAGLERPDAGRVEVAGRDVTELPSHQRGVGMVFQDQALFPHLDVTNNVAFGLVEARWPPAERAERVAELLQRFGVSHLARRRIDALSGGERQRVALARALAPRPRVLLLDEPLASLDRALRERLAQDLAGWLRSPGLASVFVTHDQDEARTVADDVAVMRAGRVVQRCAAERLVANPVDAWVARFLGHVNVFEGADAAGIPVDDDSGGVLLRDDLVEVARSRPSGPPRSDVLLAEAMVRSLARDPRGLRLDARVPAWGVTVAWRGASRELDPVPREGERVWLSVPKRALVPIAADPGAGDGPPGEVAV
jgi:ABC-type Fe3+/spermidine/putrescine transport system ATPase subunit